MEINTIEIAGLGAALTALRLPFGKEVRSWIDNDLWSDKHIDDNGNLWTTELTSSVKVSANIADLKLMQTLVKRGDEHAKCIRGIVAYVQTTAPIYWWRKLETYRAGHERLSSESTMHIDCRGLSGEELQQAKAEIPMGHSCTCVDSFSYQCLRNIVKQRHNHRLPEWHEFIDWIHTLPLADELIFVGLEEQEETTKAKKYDAIVAAVEAAKSVQEMQNFISSLFKKED